MLTKCPDCGTTFRVSPAQIKARSGKVRCGRCGSVFNALDSLLEDTGLVAAEPPPLPVPLPQEEREPAPSPAEDEEIPESAADAENPPAPLVAESRGEGDTAEPGSPPTDYLASPPLSDAAIPGRRWPWVLGSIFAVIGLLLQAAYYYRVELAVVSPELRPLVQAACKTLDCEVPRPRHIETLGIETSDLRPDPSQPGRLTLTALLRSKAPFAQEWPALELTLTDAADRKLAVKDFPAREYLPKGKNNEGAIAAGFPANGEIAIALPLDVGDLPAAGYRLYIFYP